MRSALCVMRKEKAMEQKDKRAVLGRLEEAIYEHSGCVGMVHYLVVRGKSFSIEHGPNLTDLCDLNMRLPNMREGLSAMEWEKIRGVLIGALRRHYIKDVKRNA
jgi:hypothetical protein